jgi:hypothetical protein
MGFLFTSSREKKRPTTACVLASGVSGSLKTNAKRRYDLLGFESVVYVLGTFCLMLRRSKMLRGPSDAFWPASSVGNVFCSVVGYKYHSYCVFTLLSMSLFPVTKKQPCELHEFLCCALPQNINVLFLCPCLLALSKTPGGTFHVFGMVALALKALHQIPHHRGLCPVFA